MVTFFFLRRAGRACVLERAADALHCSRIDPKTFRNLTHALCASWLVQGLTDSAFQLGCFGRPWTQHAPSIKARGNGVESRPERWGIPWEGHVAALAPASLDHRSARIDSKAKHAIIFQEGTETSSKKLSVSLFAATQVATHPGISSSDDQDMMGRVRYGSPNAC